MGAAIRAEACESLKIFSIASGVTSAGCGAAAEPVVSTIASTMPATERLVSTKPATRTTSPTESGGADGQSTRMPTSPSCR